MVIFAEEVSLNTLWQTLIVTVIGALIAYMQSRTKQAVDSAASTATTAATTAASAAADVKTALIVQKIETSAKLGEVKNAIDANTGITTQTKEIVNGRHQQLLDYVETLRKLLLEHGIDCPPHFPSKEPK